MRRLDRYIFAELLLPFLISVSSVVIMMVGTTLYDLLERILREKWPPALVGRILILNIPTVFVMALPVATALAASLATNRLARDNEITVMRGAGFSLGRIFLPMFVFGLLTTAADLYVSDRVVPWAWREQQNVQGFLDNLPRNPIEAGLTIRVESYTITFQSAQKTSDTKRRLNKVEIIDKSQVGPNEYPPITTAEWAEYDNGLWTLHNVVRHTYYPDGIGNTDSKAKTALLTLRIDFSQAYAGPQAGANSRLSFAELTMRATEARRLGQTREALNMEVARWFKLSLPAMCFAFAVCAPPLSLRFSRTGGFTGVMLSIIVVFIGWNTLLLMQYIGLGGLLPPVVAAWTTNVIFILLGLWLLRTQE